MRRNDPLLSNGRVESWPGLRITCYRMILNIFVSENVPNNFVQLLARIVQKSCL